jgi:lipopolysaccharide transport system ATP-binding protein
MSEGGDAIIVVENLGKKYRILHQHARSTLREAVTKSATAPFCWAARRFRSQIAGPRPLVAESGPSASAVEDFWALKGVSFEIKRGEVVGIIGRNGAGKSTLLKILSRITDPTEGRVTLKGRVASLLEVGTGFHPELSGRENVFLNGAILGMSRGEIRKKFDEIVAFAEIEKFLDTPVKRYSSGMYVRLAFAVAAHLEPEILIVDEVLAVGDAAFQKKCLGKMGRANEEGRTVLFVSHNMGAISSLTRRAVYLRSGAVVAVDETAAVVARYLGEAYRNDSRWTAPRATRHPLQITAVQLKDASGAASNEFEASEGFTIEIEYEARRDIRQGIIEAFIFSGDGVHLINMGEHDCDPSRLEGRRPGRYRCRIRVPGDWLNLGAYYLKVNSGVGIQETYDSEDVLSFSLVENRMNSSRYRRGGCLVPMLPWQVVDYQPLPSPEVNAAQFHP